MGRPSKLTDHQWEQIGKRLLANESAASLSREFGVSKGAISIRFSKRIETIKSVANQIVATDRAMELLNVSERMAASSLADDLKAIQGHMTGAARYGASTSHRLMGIANAKAMLVDDAKPLDDASRKELTDIAALTRTANEASEIGRDLMKAAAAASKTVDPTANRKVKELTDDELFAIATSGSA